MAIARTTSCFDTESHKCRKPPRSIPRYVWGSTSGSESYRLLHTYKKWQWDIQMEPGDTPQVVALMEQDETHDVFPFSWVGDLDNCRAFNYLHIVDTGV